MVEIVLRTNSIYRTMDEFVSRRNLPSYNTIRRNVKKIEKGEQSESKSKTKTSIVPEEEGKRELPRTFSYLVLDTQNQNEGDHLSSRKKVSG